MSGLFGKTDGEQLFVDESDKKLIVDTLPRRHDASSEIQPPVDPVMFAAALEDKRQELFSLLLPYAQQIVHDLLLEDQLVVIAAGLGLHIIVAAVIYLIDVAGTHRLPNSEIVTQPENLVFLIGLRPNDEMRVEAAFKSIQKLKNMPVRGLQRLNAETPASRREQLYKVGGLFNVTSRILIVDMLNNVVDVGKVTGILVLNAEHVSENSVEAFILRLFRSRNKHGFVKALSSEPKQIYRGFNALSNKLRVLRVSRVSLWPRFRIEVDKCLPRWEVQEVIIEMTQSMVELQRLASDCIQLCLSDIKRRVPHIESSDTWTVDRALSSNLAQNVRIAVDSVWHRLSRSARRSIADLGDLETILHLSTTMDPSQLVRFLDSAKLSAQQSDFPSPWMTLPAGEALFEVARSRLVDNEIMPKWQQLVEILEELIPKTNRILIVCKEKMSIIQILGYWRMREDYINVLKRRYDNWQESFKKIVKNLNFEPELEITEQPIRSKRRRIRGGHQDAGKTRAEFLVGTQETRDTVDLISVDEPQEFDQNFFFTQESCELRLCTYDNVVSLNEIRPDAIIMYEPDAKFTREIEVYQSILGSAVSVYFMYYQKSVEELQFLSALREEKDAFSELIKQKGSMPMMLHDLDAQEDDFAVPKVISTRIGGQLQHEVVSTPPRVIVDTREFRSALPYLIWQQRMDVVPVTLLVGDYVLTPNIVVERKSVPDLMASFRDGRLYSQCKSMFQHYSMPVLLIEFGNDQAFSLEPFREIRLTSARLQQELHAKLAVLLINFPKLKLIWSASPRYTAEIFKSLKSNDKEPDPENCVDVGQKVLFNSIALSMLQVIPGVSQLNYRLITDSIRSLRDLADITTEDLAALVGRECANKIVKFLDQKLQ